jgi:solute:Na+ symporter, SSS family
MDATLLQLDLPEQSRLVGVSISELRLPGDAVITLVVLFVAISGLTEAPSREDVRGVTWSRATMRQETKDLQDVPLWRNHRIYAVGLIVITLLALIPFL